MLKIYSPAKKTTRNTDIAYRYLKQNFQFVFLIFCSFLSNAPTLSAQTDSLLHIYQSATTSKEKTTALLSLTRLYMNMYDSTNAKHYVKELISLATSQKDTLTLIEAVNLLGNIGHQYNDIKSSLFYHQQAFFLAQASRNIEKSASMKYNIGNDYLTMRDIGRALQTYIEGIDITKYCDCRAPKLYFSGQLANIYSENMNDYQTALVWGKEALQYTEFVHKGWRVQVAKDISSFYLALNQLDSARYFADMAYREALQSTDKGQKADVLCNKSEVEAQSGHTELALDYAQQAQIIGANLPDNGLKGRILMALGDAFLLRGDKQQALKMLLVAEKYVVEAATTPHRLPKLYNLLAKTEEISAPQRAIGYLRKAAIIQDSLNNSVYKNQIALLSIQNSNALKEAENRQLKLEADNKERRALFLAFSLIITTLLLLFLLYLYRKLRAKNTELARLNTLYNQQNHVLTASNQRMEWFTNTLSHDALGYINNIMNYANFGKDGGFSKEISLILEKIHKNSVSLKKMSLNLILFNKTKEVVNTSNLALTEVVSEVIEDMGEELRPAMRSLSAQGLPMVYADKEFTKQIFRNLLSNAVKFRQPNTDLHIVISSIEHGDFVEIQVHDNGIGIAPDKLSDIFDEFTKLNKSAEGSGLGLFICKQMVEVMGGKIWAESRIKEGTVIHFTLPKYI